jgi:hypothetical protein
VFATLQPVVLWEFEALLVQVLLLLLLVPLRHVLEFFGLHYVFGRWKEDAPLPWEVNHRHQKSMSRIKESKENLQNRGEEEEEKILICNVNLVSSYKGKIEAYI